MLPIDVARELVASISLSADCLTEIAKCCVVASGAAGVSNSDNNFLSSLDLADCYNGLPLGVRGSMSFGDAPGAGDTVQSWREWGVRALTPLIECKLVNTMVASSPTRVPPRRARRPREPRRNTSSSSTTCSSLQYYDHDNNDHMEMPDLGEEGAGQEAAVYLGKWHSYVSHHANTLHLASYLVVIILFRPVIRWCHASSGGSTVPE